MITISYGKNIISEAICAKDKLLLPLNQKNQIDQVEISDSQTTKMLMLIDSISLHPIESLFGLQKY